MIDMNEKLRMIKRPYNKPKLEPETIGEYGYDVSIIKPKILPDTQLLTGDKLPVGGTFIPGTEEPMPAPTLPVRAFDRSKAEPWVMGTEPIKPQLPVASPTVEEKAAWQRAQDTYNNLPVGGNNLLNQAGRFLLENPVTAPIISITDPDMIAKEAERLDVIDKRYPDVKLPMRTTAETRAAETKAATAPVASTRPVETQTQPPIGLPVGGGITVTGVNTSGRAGFSPRTYRDASGNVVASGISSASGQGGFVGASTDAEAARNQVARLEQDAAARENAQSMLRAADLMRQNRIAARGGDPSMETRTTVVDNPLSMSGDSIQDTRARQGEYDRAVEQVLTGNAREQKGATATLAALNALREKNQAVQIAGRKEQAIDPTDTNRFLLDQQKFLWQQGVDKNKAAIEQATLQDKMAGTRMQQQKYGDERRKAFLESYSYPDKNAPQAELGALTLSLSDATKGVVPPEIMSGYLQKAAKEAGVDWEDAPPKSLVALGKRAMELAKQDTQQ